MRKNLPVAKVQVFGVFQSRLDQIITTSTSNRSKNALKIIFLQNSRFLHFSPKKIGVKNNCPETLLNFYPIKCTYLGISLFQFYLLWVRKIEFVK